MEKISIIITTFNAEKTIQSTLDSIYAQIGLNSDFSIELLITDDCSSDYTQEILDRNNLNYFSTGYNSGGPNKGRNIGLKNATGDYICFIDHDDIWHPEKLSLQLKLIKNYPIVSGGYKVIDTTNNKTINRVNNLNHISYYSANKTFLNKLSKTKEGQLAYLSTLMIRKELKNILFEEHFGMVDFDWILRLFENHESAEINECLMTRNVNGNNLSLNNDYRLKDYYFSLFTLEKYENKYPKEVDIATKRINGSMARYHYLINEMPKARKYFRKASLEVINIAYMLTSYYGNKYVKKRFNVFG